MLLEKPFSKEKVLLWLEWEHYFLRLFLFPHPLPDIEVYTWAVRNSLPCGSALFLLLPPL
jgi:hypothetical protein